MPVCTKCLQDKSQDSFFWERRRNRYAAECKACRNARSMEWAKNNRSRVNEIAHRFYARKIGKHPEECRAKRYTSEEWKVKERARAMAKYQANKDAYNARTKRWYESNKQRSRENDRKWMAEHPGRINAWRREQYRLNPAVAIARLAARKARKLQAQPKWLSAIQKAQIQEFYEIARARSVQTGIQHDVDHIFPLVNPDFCGLHVPWNLQVLSGEENKKKNTSFPVEFAHMRF